MVEEQGQQFFAHEVPDGFFVSRWWYDAQTVAIDVVRLVVGAGGVFCPVVEVASEKFTEIGGLTRVMVRDVEMRHVDRDL